MEAIEAEKALILIRERLNCAIAEGKPQEVIDSLSIEFSEAQVRFLTLETEKGENDAGD